MSQAVNPAQATTLVVSSGSPSVFGQQVTVTATVSATSPGSGTPSGTVTFKDGTTIIGTGTLNASGAATVMTGTLAVGSHFITAMYAGDPNFQASASGTPTTQTVNPAQTTTLVVSSVNPSVVGRSVTFAATVAAASPGTGIPTGKVQFYDGTAALGAPRTLNSSGVATLATAALTLGSHPITAQYLGATNYQASTSGPPVAQRVLAATTTSISSSGSPSAFGQQVTFTATVAVASPGSGIPSGQVQFYDGGTALGGPRAVNGGGVATLATTGLTVGTHAITARYLGTTNDQPSTSSPPTPQTVIPATRTIVVSSVNPSVFGQQVMFTATVTANPTGSGTPSGQVQFYDGTATLGGPQSLNGSGVATLPIATLTVGTHSITAKYLGTTGYGPSTSSPAVTQTVTAAATTTRVTSSVNPSVFGQPVTFTATVTASPTGSGTPSGQVQFYDGTAPLGGPQSLNGSGVATLPIATLTVGTHSITAVYAAATNYQSSTSTAVSQQVTAATTTTSLLTSGSPSIVGQPVTFTATVSASSPGSGTPTGTVTFKDGGTTIGTGTLSGGTATFTPSSLAVGTHSVTAAYGGDSNFQVSTSSPATQQVIINLTVTVRSLSGAVEGQSDTFAVAAVNEPGSSDPASSYGATIDWGDGTAATSGTVTGSNGSYTVTGTHTYTEEGSYAVTVTATKTGVSGSASATGAAGVADAPLSLSSSLPAQNWFVNKQFSKTLVTFTDANPGATSDDFSGTINWGDGTTDAWTAGQGTTGPYNVHGTHTYTRPGFYTVAVTVNDVGGSSVSAPIPFNVGPTDTGNPCPCSCTTCPDLKSLFRMVLGLAGLGGTASSHPVRYSDGTIELNEVDLSSVGFGMPWGQTRSYSNGELYDTTGLLGQGWTTSQLPFVEAIGGDLSTLAVIMNGSEAHYFDQISGTTYQARNFDPAALSVDGSGRFVMTSPDGSRVTFQPTGVPNAAGVTTWTFQSFTDPDGNVTAVTSSTGQLPLEVRRSTTSGGSTVTESYLYAYTTVAGATRLQSVTLRRETNGGAWSTVRQVQYTFYNGEGFGNPGELKYVKILDGTGNVLDTTYYRYYATEPDGTNPANGYAGALRFEFDSDSYARLVAAGLSPDSATDAQVAPYADEYFEYNANHRVSKEVASAAGCSACSGGLGSFGYTYVLSQNAASYSNWAMKTTETLPDGNENIIYTNSMGAVLLSVYLDTTTGQQWLTYYQYDSLGRPIATYDPSDVSGFNDAQANLGVVLNNTGLVTTYSYYASTTATETTPGGAANRMQSVRIQQGNGPAVLQESWQYYAHAANGGMVYPVATDTVYRNADGTGAETTTNSYTWFPGTAAEQTDTVTLPAIPAAQNGPGTPDVETTVLDAYGRPVWHKDADGFITYTQYDPATRAVVETIDDVNTSITGDFVDLPAGWVTPAGGGLNLVTSDQVDALGRTVKETDPNGNVSYTVYNDLTKTVFQYDGWNAATGQPTGPTTVLHHDQAGNFVETFTMSAAPHLTNGAPDGTEAVGGLQTLSRQLMNAAGQVVEQDDYFNLSGISYAAGAGHRQLGTAGTNFYATLYQYDHRGRLERVVDPNGTITRTVYDGLGRVTSVWVGTKDTPASGYWSPANNTAPSNMVDVADYVYDNGGVGDGNLTRLTKHPGNGQPDRVTQMTYDWRDRLVETKDGVQAAEDTTTHRPIIYVTYDNLNQVVMTQAYDGDTVQLSSLGSTNGVPNAPAASLLRAQTVTSYDDQGRVYQTQVFDVNPSTGAVGGALVTNDYYDHRGDLIAESAPGGVWTKDVYDGDGRLVVEYTTDGGGGTTWSAASGVANDIVLEQSQTVYDNNGNVIETIDSQRFDTDGSATGALGTPTSGIGARVYYSASYYDAVDRLTATVDVGTNGGVAWTRPGTVPAASDAALVTLYGYNAAGWLQDVTDPRGLDTRTYYDNLGRVTKTIEDYTDGTPTSGSNKTTASTYDGDGHVVTLAITNVSGGVTTVQTTKYVYGVSTPAISSNDLLATVEHPDPTTGQPSTAANQEDTYTYDSLGEVLTATDRNGTTHSYTYDVLGRRTSDAVTVLGAGVDGAIRRIDTAYDTQGNAYLVTSYDSVSGGNVVNQVLDQFNGLGQLTADYQSHGGAVVIGTTPASLYTYNETANGENNSRLVSMTYPNGRVITYNYGTVGSLDDHISRLTSLSDPTGALEAYTYLGLGTVVQRVQPQASLELTYIQQPGDGTGDGGDRYFGLDRFGRVVSQRWINTVTQLADDWHEYGYDRDGNVVWKVDEINPTFSEWYSYDQLNQLAGYARGTLNANHIGVSGSPTDSQSWSTDSLGNFSSVTTNGAAQTRTTNAQNELTSVGGVALTYDADGNLTTDDHGQALVYDAWNRLVKVTKGGATVETFSYDGADRRITEGGTDLYYGGEHLIEERVGGVATTQYVWSAAGGGNTLVEADLSQNGGYLNYRVYVTQDIVDNVTAVVDTTGTVVERSVYEPYGQRLVLNPDYTPKAGNTSVLVIGFQGMREERAVGLVASQTRFYSATLARWVSADWIGYAGGDQNLYRFVQDSPIGSADWSGFAESQGFWGTVWNNVVGFGDGLLGPRIPVSEFKPVMLLGPSVPVSQFKPSMLLGPGVPTNQLGTAFRKGTIAREAGMAVSSAAVGAATARVMASGRSTGQARSPSPTASAAPPCKSAVPPKKTPLTVNGQTTCFVAGTPLLTPDGARPIEAFNSGDQILSRSDCDPEGPVEIKIVADVFVRVAPVMALEVGGQTIRTTAEHPFYVVGRGWLTAAELQAGDLLAGHDKSARPVVSISGTKEVTTVYNLEVTDHHTYFVGCQEWGFSVWAHNASDRYIATVMEIDGKQAHVLLDTETWEPVRWGQSGKGPVRTFDSLEQANKAIQQIEHEAAIAGEQAGKAGCGTGRIDLSGKSSGGAEHTSGARGSTAETHQVGQTRKAKDYGGEKADLTGRRRYPRKPPDGWKGPWPPPE